MSDPFHIDGPACISFSGGRTSGLMLARVLGAYGGTLPSDIHVLFANTGKERDETLDFVRDCGERWDVAIEWLEFALVDGEPTYRVVTHATASRLGEPFDALINWRSRLPNPIARICTAELKVRVMRDRMRVLGYEHWTNVVGLRADEPRRVANMRRPNRERWDVALPLADARIALADVDAFWATQPFGLRLKPWEGNCDLCFLKSISKRERIIEDRPDLAAWWVDAERRDGQPFRVDVVDFKTLVARVARRSLPLFATPAADPSDLGDCACTD